MERGFRKSKIRRLVLLADGLPEGVDGSIHARVHRHGHILHLKGNAAVAAHHMNHGEEFLPITTYQKKRSSEMEL